jgi:hypothetical protein
MRAACSTQVYRMFLDVLTSIILGLHFKRSMMHYVLTDYKAFVLSMSIISCYMLCSVERKGIYESEIIPRKMRLLHTSIFKVFSPLYSWRWWAESQKASVQTVGVWNSAESRDLLIRKQSTECSVEIFSFLSVTVADKCRALQSFFR